MAYKAFPYPGDPRLTKGTDRCQCGACEKYFGSTYAFDRHQVGPHGWGTRRCLTTEEMGKKGMALNSGGYWIGKPMGNAALERARRSLGAAI